jgi:hypothetical protein
MRTGPPTAPILFSEHIFFFPAASCPVVLSTLDLKTHERFTVPGSEGLWSPRWSPDGKSIVPLNTNMHLLMLGEIANGKWSELVRYDRGMGILGRR